MLLPDSNSVAISPDGRLVAFIVGTPRGRQSQLWVRSLDSLDGAARCRMTRRRRTCRSGRRDSRTVGYFTASKLKIVPAAGGRAQNLADVAGGRGADWNAANVIVYAPDTSGPLFRVDANGGAPQQLTTIDAAKKQITHRFPAFLPDGDHFLYAALPGRNGRYDIFIGSLAGGAPELLTSLESGPIYAEPGYLLFTRGRASSPRSRSTQRRGVCTGDPITLADEPASILDPVIGYTASHAVSVASNGSLAYYSALVAEHAGRLVRPSGQEDRIAPSCRPVTTPASASRPTVNT